MSEKIKIVLLAMFWVFAIAVSSFWDERAGWVSVLIGGTIYSLIVVRK